MDKRGMELPLNMIIIVILALIFLGAALFILRDWLPSEPPHIPSMCEVYPPDAQNPVCANDRYEFSRGETKQLSVAFYNDGDSDLGASDIPDISCGMYEGNSPELTVSSVGKSLPVGSHSDYLVIIKIPKDAPRGTYPCILSLGSAQKSFALVVN